ncbi:MAG: hypothetical protein JW727_02815 [Candidatus Aenigmarchaeota archaeon]|nr:hypothetical protein [Candidatus Aenigmarchaeota archaeon]
MVAVQRRQILAAFAVVTIGMGILYFGGSGFLQGFFVGPDEAEPVNLWIVNHQSYPNIGGNWTVVFFTNGTANLTVRPINGTYYGEDINFLEVRCMGKLVAPTYLGEYVFFENYFCEGASTETSQVVSFGRHDIEFSFGTILDIAHNGALYTLPRNCVDGSGETCSDYCSLRVYVCDTASPCTTRIVMTEKRGSCSDSTWYEQAFDPSSCTNFDNPEVCLGAGSNPNYFYIWARSGDYEQTSNIGQLYAFSTNDLDGDTCQGHCDCIAGQLRWNIGGEVASTSCCGDDSGEYRVQQVFGTGMDGLADETDACCTASNSCVNYGNCYSTASSVDADGDGDTDYCNAGTWVDCNSAANCPSGMTCTSNNCV